MFDKITYVCDDYIKVALKAGIEVRENLLNVHVVIADTEKYVLGEIVELENNEVKIILLGEFSNGDLKSGILRKPLLNAQIRELVPEEIPLILGKNEKNTLLFGTSPYYNNHPVYIDIEKLFGGHFVVLGNSGSGKSYGVTSLLQSVFKNPNLVPVKSNFILFDISGEYTKAFEGINQINPSFNYRLLTTNPNTEFGETLRIPPWILNEDDYCLLLRCDSHGQRPIIERMLKLARIFASSGSEASRYKDHLIAKAIISILYSNQTAARKRDDIFTIVENCKTPSFNLFTTVQGIGYTRTFKDCFLIDKQGQFSESILLTQYVSSFVNDSLDNYEAPSDVTFSLQDLSKALDFTLISDGWFKNEEAYSDAILVQVRLQSLLANEYKDIFSFSQPITAEEYIINVIADQQKKYQIVNINMDDIDDNVASVIAKIFSRLILSFAKKVQPRGSIPFHLIVEEAHRYIRHDKDEYIIGYNIFERLAKEGRKYGVLLGIVSQRPVEISETVLSQATNFIIFKTNHPRDAEYIRQMIPNINSEAIEKQKTLQSGTCVAFGTAFKLPTIVNINMPDPMPSSYNCDIMKYWS